MEGQGIAGKDRTLGDSYRWSLLFDANRNQIIDPDEIEVDQNLAYKARYTRIQNNAAEKKGRDREVFVPKN